MDPDVVFERSALGIVHVGSQNWRAFRGKYRDFVEQQDFLVAVGRRDLADQMRSAHIKEGILNYGGRAVAFAGVVLLAADLSPGGFEPPPKLGLAMVGAGLLSWLLSGLVSDRVATPEQAEAFAAHYNDGLRTHLEKRPRSPQDGNIVLRPRIGPWIGNSATGSGVALALTF